MSDPGISRRTATLALLAPALAACGGGGGGTEPTAAIEGSRVSSVVASRVTGTTYRLQVYLPPASAGPRDALPVLYVLDGESWFETLVGLAESRRHRVVVAAVHGEGQRNRDYVPGNSCTGGGGGHGAYLGFVLQELLPHVEATFGGDARQRLLFGHSHGGAFVLFALFAQPPGQHAFRSYLACDASLGCLTGVADDWEWSYSARHASLPVRLHQSCATLGNQAANVRYAGLIAARRYAGLAFADPVYTGTHGGIVPQALADGLAFGLAPAA